MKIDVHITTNIQHTMHLYWVQPLHSKLWPFITHCCSWAWAHLPNTYFNYSNNIRQYFTLTLNHRWNKIYCMPEYEPKNIQNKLNSFHIDVNVKTKNIRRFVRPDCSSQNVVNVILVCLLQHGRISFGIYVFIKLTKQHTRLK